MADISKEVGDYDLYTPEMITKNVEVKKGDILIINTGYHRYAWDQKQSDELRYFVKHPGPAPGFHKWALDMKLKWIGVDCGSADHPMNTIIRNWHPARFAEAETEAEGEVRQELGRDVPAGGVLPGDAHQAVPEASSCTRRTSAGRLSKVSNQRRLDRRLPTAGHRDGISDVPDRGDAAAEVRRPPWPLPISSNT